ncbi:MAG: AAA family ATPase [Sedimentisphaerales bacterium]|nr:AAA family ATPase [Sedimentisphaerales bacterium]
MIERITIKNFKSFKDVTLKLGPLNIFIGPNASGKSNFFDALRVLQGIGYGFTLSEILDGKPKSATSEVWEGIRGGSERIGFAPEEANKPTSFRVDWRLPEELGLSITFSPKEGQFCQESLSIPGQFIYSAGPTRVLPHRQVHYFSQTHKEEWADIDDDRPVLTQIARRADRRVELLPRLLADMQRIDPSPVLLRAYSQAYEIKRMGEHGENFAALIRMICNDPAIKEAYLSWLRELRPRDVDDVGVLKGALGEPMVMMKERGREWPAPALSDGTLRFAAIAAAFFQPDMPGILTIEEIENGIHASRLRLLVELLRSRAAAGKTQVMVTTHSPIVLAWLKPEEYATTFYCRREEETGESRIVPLNEIPRFNEIVSKQPISDLFAEGWMETAL